MRVKLQLVLCSDDGREETVTDIVSLKKDCHRIEHLGLTLADSKQLLKSWEAKKKHFEVIVGKSTLAFKRDDDDEAASPEWDEAA